MNPCGPVDWKSTSEAYKKFDFGNQQIFLKAIQNHTISKIDFIDDDWIGLYNFSNEYYCYNSSMKEARNVGESAMFICYLPEGDKEQIEYANQALKD